MTHLQKCKQTKMCSRPMSPSNSCLISLFSFPNKAYHYNCPFLLSLFLISNSSINHFNQALVLIILSRSPTTCILPKPMFVWFFFLLASYWTTQEHLILLNTLSFMKHFLLELPGLPTPLVFLLLLNLLCFPRALSLIVFCPLSTFSPSVISSLFA